jgi:hypothetical protein
MDMDTDTDNEYGHRFHNILNRKANSVKFSLLVQIFVPDLPLTVQDAKFSGPRRRGGSMVAHLTANQ